MKDDKILPVTEESDLPPEEEKVKSAFQKQKESWYDKVPLTVKQLDIIIGVGFALLALTFVCMILEANDIIHLFG